MNRQIAGWGLGFFVTSVGAALLLAASLHPTLHVEPESHPAPRDPANVSDVELDLILNKIRGGDLHAMNDDLDSARKEWAEARRLGVGLWPIHEGLGDSYARANLHAEAIA